MILPNKIIEILHKKACECISVRELVSDNDYERFALAVADITNTIQISINTWKRVFGYLRPKDGGRFETSTKTCQVIAEYLGCKNWQELFENTDEIYNRFINNNAAYDNSAIIMSDDETQELISSLKPGDRIKVRYYPQRELILEFLSVNRYRIIKKVNISHLCNADVLEIQFLRKHQPLAATMLKRNDAILGRYCSASNHTLEEISLVSRK